MMENNSKKEKASLIYAIVGVALLIVAVAGSTYAYYAASVSNNTAVNGAAGGGTGPTMTITKVSTQATGNLIPIDMTVATLNTATQGHTDSGNKACVDKHGYTACQIYSVTVTNNSSTPQAFSINLTSLSGDNVPNLDAVTMGTVSDAVTSATSIKSNGLICTTESVAGNGTSAPCYFMVFIRNQNEPQTDSGAFTGTVTATSTTGSQIKADFS